MSLLMDALKKAEEAKRQVEATAAAQTEASVISPSVDESSQRGLPALPARLELLDAEFHTGAKPEVAPPLAQTIAEATQQQERDRASAQNLFAAKQPESRNLFPILIGGVTLAALIGIGVYFWLQLHASGASALKPAAPYPLSASGATHFATAPVPVINVAAPLPTPVASPSLPARAIAPAAHLVSEPPPAPTSPIRFTSSHLKVNPAVAQAYQAYSRGDLPASRREYEQVLRTEPKNSDALHGLAAISLRQGQPDAAEDYYLRALEADPKDATAQAALLSLRGQVDPVQSESRLKTLLAGQPESAALNFSLGNLYARQNRWNEAQQAYFRAYTVDAENPDYLFNLAVSLEQIRQPKLALQYYQSALAAAAQRPAAFDKNQAAGRVRELQQ